MISPKYSLTHYYNSTKYFSALKSSLAPHIVNLYLDYNCPFSAKLFLKLQSKVIPELNEKHPGQFQFVFVNVIQPWHPNSVLLHEYSLVVAKLLRENAVENSNEVFWNVSKAIFENKEHFYDTANVNLNRNEIYESINNLVFDKVSSLPISKNDVLKGLVIEHNASEPHNSGNEATNDVKYFTKYLRGVGVHVTPTVSLDGIVSNDVSSGSEPSELVKVFESGL